MITLKELLSLRGFHPNPKRVKLVRHKDARFDLDSLRRTGWFDIYQQYQAKPVFDGCDQIVSFLGEEGFHSRFVGVYDVGLSRLAGDAPVPAQCPHPEWAAHGKVHYTLTKRPGFDDFEDRLVIDWGKAALAWHQWFTSDRRVIEIRPSGRSLPPFQDYLRVVLTFDELVRLMTAAEAHRDWVASLSAVGGIYLIVNTVTGEQYVGSATGNGGIWQRWSEYAKPATATTCGFVRRVSKEQSAREPLLSQSWTRSRERCHGTRRCRWRHSSSASSARGHSG